MSSLAVKKISLRHLSKFFRQVSRATRNNSDELSAIMKWWLCGQSIVSTLIFDNQSVFRQTTKGNDLNITF